MFGYIKPFKPELRIREYDEYQAVYCGLCNQLGKSFGIFARLTLSYDFVFLYMLICLAQGESPSFSRRRCCVNPLKKVPMCEENEAGRFSVDIAALMMYHKVLDNIQDEGLFGGVRWRFLLPFVSRAGKKAAAARPEASEVLARTMREQKLVEDGLSDSPDEACEPSASAMAAICAGFSEDAGQKRVLERLGYLTGRYVYLSDALDDLEDDLKRNRYNPLIYRYRLRGGGDFHAAREETKHSLLMTIGEMEKTCDLLAEGPYRPLIDNVVRLGLRCSVEAILSKKEKNS